MSDTVIVKCNVLNAVQSQEIIALKDRIKRLEEAGDVVEKKLGCGCGCYGLCKDCQRASENWLKAKEAKP